MLHAALSGDPGLAIPNPGCAAPAFQPLRHGADIPDGTQIEALIKDKVVASTQSLTYQGDSVYALDIPGDDLSTALVEGGVEGDVITFKIGGILADQSGTWRSASNLKLDLSASTTSTPLPPQASPTLSPTQTPTNDLVSIQAPQANQAPALNQPAATRQPETPVEAVAATPNATLLPEPTQSDILTEPLQTGKANTG